jgi:hypothetical protein
MTETTMDIRSARLTTCGILQDGQVVRLDLVDDKGATVSLQLPFDQAQAMAMTLPTLLTRALKSLTGSATARYVFPLERWLVEQSGDTDGLVLTLATADGFQVSFGVPSRTSRALGSTLSADTDRMSGADDAEEELEAAVPVALN